MMLKNTSLYKPVRHRIVKASLLVSCLLLISRTAFSQYSLEEKVNQTKALVGSKDMVTAYIFDSLLYLHQKSLSGSQVKEGKATGTSLSITDKGATANIGFAALFKNKLYSSLTFSGSGDEKFIDVLKGGKYRNTLSSGAILNFFPAYNSGFFDRCKRNILHARIESAMSLDVLQEAVAKKAKIDAAIDSLMLYECLIKNLGNCETGKIDFSDEELEIIERAENARSLLDSLQLLSRTYSRKSFAKKTSELGDLSNSIKTENIADELLLQKTEALQMSADWNAFSVHWITLKADYNIAAKPMITPRDTTNFYLGNYNNEYATVSLSYNYMKARLYGRKFQFSVSPTCSFSSERQFDKLEMIKINRATPYSAIVDNPYVNKVEQSEGYESTGKRLVKWSLEFPLVLYWGNSNFGIEIAPRAGGNDAKGDNVGGRIGIYIPLDLKDNVPVWIQPVLRIGNLFNRDKMDFVKDNLSFGFNLTVSLSRFNVVPKKS